MRLKYRGLYRFSRFPQWNILILEFRSNPGDENDRIVCLTFSVENNSFEAFVTLNIDALGTAKFLGILGEDAILTLSPKKFQVFP